MWWLNVCTRQTLRAAALEILCNRSCCQRLEIPRYRLGSLWAHHVEKMSTMAWRTNTSTYKLHTHRYGWFSTTLKIRETYMLNKIGPRQLPCGTPQSISKLLEEFWLMRTRWEWQERKDEIHFFALPTTPMSVSNISCVLLQWRAAEAKHAFKKTLWKQFSKAVVRHLNVNL